MSPLVKCREDYALSPARATRRGRENTTKLFVCEGFYGYFCRPIQAKGMMSIQKIFHQTGAGAPHPLCFCQDDRFTID